MAEIQTQSNGISKPKFYIAIPPVDIAQDAALVSHLTELINAVYTVAETGIFDAAYLRTNTTEVSQFLSSQALALASTSHEDPWSSPSNIKGCVRIMQISPTMGEIGILVAGPEVRGSGLGKQLVDFAEDYCRNWGATKMMLELLVPSTFEHGLKTWISAWYQRLGYKIVGVSDFREKYPKIAESVITPTDYFLFEKEFT